MAIRLVAAAVVASPYAVRGAVARASPFAEPKPLSFIYLMRCCQHVKIGVAADVERRRFALQTANPFPIEILCYRDVGNGWVIRAERLAHAALSDHRLHGEWFSAEPALAKAVLLAAVQIVKAERRRDATIARRATPKLQQEARAELAKLDAANCEAAHG